MVISNLFPNFYTVNQKGIRLEKQAININNDPIKKSSGAVRLNDIGFRVILIPAFGVVIPLITGMVNQARLSNWQIKFSFLFTIGIAFIIWEGNRYLLFTLRSYFDWFNKPVRKIAVLVLAISVVSFPLLLDRDVGLRTAVLTSISAVTANPGPMAVWGLIVAGGLVIGSIPAFLGLIIVMPVLGHATWHLYRKVVDPSTLQSALAGAPN